MNELVLDCGQYELVAEKAKDFILLCTFSCVTKQQAR